MNKKIKIFYKYRSLDDNSFEYVVDSLKNKYFYFAKPEELNDPFDCFAPIDNTASDEQIKNWILQSEFAESLTVKGVREILAKPNSYNDFLKSEKEALKKLHVLSLCEDCKNEMMWSMYAKNYTGIVLCYTANKINDNWYIPLITDDGIKMSKSKYILYDKEVSYIRLRKIIYDNDGTKKYNQFLNNKENINYSLEHKKKHWSGEKEYRAILTVINDSVVKLRYPDFALLEIIFGFNACKDKILEIKKIISENYKSNVKFYIAEPDYTSYQIKLTDL